MAKYLHNLPARNRSWTAAQHTNDAEKTVSPSQAQARHPKANQEQMTQRRREKGRKPVTANHLHPRPRTDSSGIKANIGRELQLSPNLCVLFFLCSSPVALLSHHTPSLHLFIFKENVSVNVPVFASWPVFNCSPLAIVLTP